MIKLDFLPFKGTSAVEEAMETVEVGEGRDCPKAVTQWRQVRRMRVY